MLGNERLKPRPGSNKEARRASKLVLVSSTLAVMLRRRWAVVLSLVPSDGLSSMEKDSVDKSALIVDESPASKETVT